MPRCIVGVVVVQHHYNTATLPTFCLAAFVVHRPVENHDDNNNNNNNMDDDNNNNNGINLHRRHTKAAKQNPSPKMLEKIDVH